MESDTSCLRQAWLLGNISLGTKTLKILWICYQHGNFKRCLLKIYKIIVVTSLKIIEFFGYKHLEGTIVRRQDDHLYRFREGDFKRLRRQDIEDMLLLLLQGKLTNLNLDERFALNVALRIYTRRIVIQERVEDLQLAMEYLPKRKWSKQDKQRARVMINAIDKKLRDRRLMRSLEKFVGGRPYRGDLQLLQRTI
ncbi:hypothetical protein Tco_0326883 [Tanacetum coccineum]